LVTVFLFVEDFPSVHPDTENALVDLKDEKAERVTESLEETTSSTNEYGPAETYLQYISTAILVIQFLSIVFCLDQALQNVGHFARDAGLVVIRIFIAVYISVEIPNTVSNKVYFKFLSLNLYHVNKMNEEISFQLIISTGIKALFFIIAIYPIQLFNILKSIYRLTSWYSVLNEINILLELIVHFLAVCTTAVVTKSFMDPLNSILNFIGVLLILDLDERVGKFIGIPLKTDYYFPATKNSSHKFQINLVKRIFAVILLIIFLVYFLVYIKCIVLSCRGES
jgi:hypothetical protein